MPKSLVQRCGSGVLWKGDVKDNPPPPRSGSISWSETSSRSSLYSARRCLEPDVVNPVRIFVSYSHSPDDSKLVLG